MGTSCSPQDTTMAGIVSAGVATTARSTGSCSSSSDAKAGWPWTINSDDGALPRHQHGKGRHLSQVDIGCEANATFGGPHGRQVLNPVAEDRVDLVVVVVAKREADDRCLLRAAQTIRHVGVEPHQDRDPVELPYGLMEHR